MSKRQIYTFGEMKYRVMKKGKPGTVLQQEYAVDVEISNHSLDTIETLFDVALDVFQAMDEYRLRQFENGEDLVDLPTEDILSEIEAAQHLPKPTVEEINISNLERWRIIIENGFQGEEMETYLRDSYQETVKETLWFNPEGVQVEGKSVYIMLPDYPVHLSFEAEEEIHDQIENAKNVRFWRDLYEVEAPHDGSLSEMKSVLVIESKEHSMYVDSDPIKEDDHITIEDMQALELMERPAQETNTEKFFEILQRGYFNKREQLQLFSLAMDFEEAVILDYWSFTGIVLEQIVEAANWHLISIPQAKQAIVTSSKETAEELAYIPEEFPEKDTLEKEDKKAILSAAEYPTETITHFFDSPEYYVTIDGERELLSLYQSGYMNYREVKAFFVALYPVNPTREDIEEAVKYGQKRMSVMKKFEDENDFSEPYCTRLLEQISENPQYLSEEYF